MVLLWCCFLFFFFKQKTAYEMRISDWSSDVCSSDLQHVDRRGASPDGGAGAGGDGSPGGHHVVDQQQAPALQRGGAPRIDGEGTGHVAPALGPAEAALRGRRQIGRAHV